MSAPRIALIGANGHGHWHRRHLVHRAEQVDLVALCDLAPIEDIEGAPVPPGAQLFTDHRVMLEATRPDVVIICTPPHTHLALASDAIAAGCDLLLEKPPVVSIAEHHQLAQLLQTSGRACQVGFQALGSGALVELLDAVRAGVVGKVTGVAAIASWQRGDAYYARSAWAGKRSVDGHAVLDGALVNPLAHAVMQSLAIAEAEGGGPTTITEIELERYRARPIEVEDTACLRVQVENGPPILVAVTLCGEEFIAGEIIVHGTDGDAVLEYPTDRIRLPGDERFRAIPGRVSLLDNLLAHRTDPGRVGLIAPLARTMPFTVIAEAVATAAPPVAIASDRLSASGEGPTRQLTLGGVNAVIRSAGAQMSLFSELGADWAVRGSEPPGPQTTDPPTTETALHMGEAATA